MRPEFQYRPELVHESAFIADNATVLGAVTVGEESTIWFGAVVRGDTERIMIGRQSNVQDLCVLHADEGIPCILGDRVTVGHAAIVHGAIVEDDVMIGMRAVILNRVRIGTGSIIAAGAVLPEGFEVPPKSLVMGLPGKIRREVTDDDVRRIQHAAAHYVAMGRRFRDA
jgi:carbonic anhydrase/acetyltransferase-like protein (isoleucine patch superfamily)